MKCPCKIFLFSLMFLVSVNAFGGAKDTLRKYLPGWYYAAHVGIQMPSSKPANFHNGMGPNSINKFLGYPQNYDLIYRAIGNYNFHFDSTNSPQAMKYNPATEIGFHIRTRSRNHMFFFAEISFYKARTSDYFYLVVDDPSFQFDEDKKLQCGITGVENRNDLNFGFGKVFYKKRQVSPMMLCALNINNTKVTKSEMQIEGTTYSIYNAYYSYNQIEEGGIGLGGMAGFGMNAIFNRNFSLEIYPLVYWKTINLIDNKRSGFAYSLCMRFLFHNSGDSN